MKAPPIFVISLARDAGRRARMISRLEELGAEYEIVDAVDGNDLDLSALGERLQLGEMQRVLKRHLTAGEIGCYLSHYGILERVVADKIPAAAVLEDDAVLDSDFAEVVFAAAAIPYEWDMISLHRAENRDIKETLCEIDSAHAVARLRNRIWCLTGYMVSLSGAEKLSAKYWRISDTVDAAFSEYWESGIKLYSVSPCVVRPEGSPSNIPGRTARKKKLVRWRIWLRGLRRRVYDFRHPLSREKKTRAELQK